MAISLLLLIPRRLNKKQLDIFKALRVLLLALSSPSTHFQITGRIYITRSRISLIIFMMIYSFLLIMTNGPAPLPFYLTIKPLAYRLSLTNSLNTYQMNLQLTSIISLTSAYFQAKFHRNGKTLQYTQSLNLMTGIVF
jgi:hypothetical protein